MNIGVILNRVFRINNNPLFEYINQQKDAFDTVSYTHLTLPTILLV